jgi:hypothetical protein
MKLKEVYNSVHFVGHSLHDKPQLQWSVHQSGYDEVLQLHKLSILGTQCSNYSAASSNQLTARRMYRPPQLVHTSF